MATILIGLGGTGGKILKAFRQRLWTEFAPAERKQLPISYIYVDTDRALLNRDDVSYQTIHGDCSFEATDFVDIKSNSDINAIFGNPQGHKSLLGILGNVAETDAAVSPVGAAADQKRRAGRILFAANASAYVSKLQQAVESVRRGGEMIYIYVFAGLAGGTGSGSIVDVISQTRKWMFNNGMTEDDAYRLVVFCQLPENTPPANWNTGRYKANGYAALLELNNLFTSQYNTQWGAKTNRPPFDTTSQVELGRLFLDFSERTPEKIKEGRIPQNLKIANGLIVYSNINDFGYTLKSDQQELPQLVADFVYTLVFMPKNDATGELVRFVTFENLANNRNEYDETADPEVDDVMPVRTRAIGSFGIKRIVVPEYDIQEYIAYGLGLYSLYQIKFDNWSNTTGYRNEVSLFDTKAYADDEGRRASWMMSRPHMMLKRYILEGDKKENWPEGDFSTYWNPCIDAWAEVAKGADSPFNKLIDLCRGGYEKGFRKKGVEPFFNDKATAVDIYSKKIADNLETYLFGEWEGGRLSLYAAAKVAETLRRELYDEIRKMTEVDEPDLERKISEYEANIKATVEEYLNANIIKRPIIFSNRFERVTQFCKYLYNYKTELAALRLFTEPLARAVLSRVEELEKRLIDFQNRVDDLVQYSKDRMSALADVPVDLEQDKDGTEDMTQPIVKYYSRKRLSELLETLLHDRQRMEGINADMRKAIVAALQSDGHFSNLPRFNNRVLSDALLGNVYNRIKNYHQEVCKEMNQKVLDMPILERLYLKYGNNENALTDFAEKIIKASGVFTQTDMNEINLHNANTEPPVIGMNILMKRIIVLLPKTEDPDLLRFSNDLRTKLENAIPGGMGASVKVTNEGNRNNEITVAIMQNGFPMRAIASVPMMRAEYDNLIAQDPKNKILLHTEGTAADYRSIYAKPAMTPDQMRDAYVPYMMIDLALEKILKDTDRTGEYGSGTKGLLTTEVTPWGYASFVDLIFSDQVVRERGAFSKRLFNEGMYEAMADVDVEVKTAVAAKLQEIEQKMMADIKAAIVAEAPSRDKLKQMEKWLVKAIEILKQYKPNK